MILNVLAFLRIVKKRSRGDLQFLPMALLWQKTNNQSPLARFLSSSHSLTPFSLSDQLTSRHIHVFGERDYCRWERKVGLGRVFHLKLGRSPEPYVISVPYCQCKAKVENSSLSMMSPFACVPSLSLSLSLFLTSSFCRLLIAEELF